jgi:hypothetical protein
VPATTEKLIASWNELFYSLLIEVPCHVLSTTAPYRQLLCNTFPSYNKNQCRFFSDTIICHINSFSGQHSYIKHCISNTMITSPFITINPTNKLTILQPPFFK